MTELATQGFDYGQLEPDARVFVQTQTEEIQKMRIADAARQIAERFMQKLAEGDDAAIQAFIGDPPGYNGWQRKRDEWKWLRFGQEHGPVALRQKMLEAAQDSLVDERVKDLEAECEVLLEAVRKREAELCEWRTGERIYRQ